MAQERLSMTKIVEVLRLKQKQGLSNRDVARSCKVGRRTVAEYLRRAVSAGIDWEAAGKLAETELQQRLFPERLKPGPFRGRRIPEWIYIYEEMKKKHVTLLLLWQEYKEQHNEEGCGYSWFLEQYRLWRKTLKVCMRQEHRAGDKLFVDYCDGLKVVNRATGEIVETQLFVGVWGASNYTYAEATFGQNKRDWIMSHVRALEYYDCIPKAVVCDNLKAGVKKPCRYEPEINREYLDLSQYYGFTVFPARVGKSRDKAKVEAGVLVAQRWILACLRNRTFFSLGGLNEAISVLLEKLNNRRMQKLNKTRKEMFEQLDRPAAQILNQKHYEYVQWEKATVNIDYHVEVDSHYYSVPYQLRLLGQRLDIRLSDNMVEVLYKNSTKRITSHVRSFRKWHHTTKPEHMCKSHRKYLEWTPSRMINWASKIGPSTGEVVKTVLNSRKYPEQAYRSCLGILRLSDIYSKERLEKACKRAAKYSTFSYKSIKTILKYRLDEQKDLFENQEQEVSPKHDNVRGQDYYKGGELLN